VITTPAFDSEQKRVVALPENARAFITAGPGAGKTYTLVARARRLIDEKEFSPSDLLVLSFTNAVITELRRRDREQGPSSAFFPETFDAFASRLLAAHDVGGDWRIAGYDQRIRAATQLIRDGAASEWLERVRHIFVDEVQDLVGPRAELVEALLQAHRAGFTAFGDPAQAIYDHEQPEGGRTLIRTLVAGLASVMQDLPRNHRASADWAPVIAHTRAELLSGNELAGIDVKLG
jgi:superfamily I DNA/RNA helicase